MPHIRTDDQPATQITVIEPEPDKQAEALSVMTERARFMARQPGRWCMNVEFGTIRSLMLASMPAVSGSERNPGMRRSSCG